MFALLASLALAGETCQSPAATAAFERGFAAQQAMRVQEALAAYGECLSAEPNCVPCLWESGWSRWTVADWAGVVADWEKVVAIEPNHAGAAEWLPKARERAASPVDLAALRVPIGTTSTDDGSIRLRLVARFPNYDPNPTDPADHHDPDIFSPKSARFHPDGSRVYVNSLEAFKTVIYDPRTLERKGLVEHRFDADDAPLFYGQTTVFDYPYQSSPPDGDPNHFAGKPVESCFSHGGRWLWVPYYRRSWDSGATSPSAVAIVDTRTDQIVRVMPTGPIPKYVVASPDDRWLAVTHWGDNTLGVVDISSGDPASFRYVERLVVEQILPQEELIGTDRDATCGWCLRGTVFTPDSKVLLVARMGGGGVAGFEVGSWRYLGTIDGEPPTPRHLVISPDGRWLYLSSNRAGKVSRLPVATAVELLRGAGGGRVTTDAWESVEVGGGARTLEVSPDGRWLFVASNRRSEVVVAEAETLRVAARVRTDPYTVGLDVSPDGRQVWTTSQGHGDGGGNSVCVYEVSVEP